MVRTASIMGQMASAHLSVATALVGRPLGAPSPPSRSTAEMRWRPAATAAGAGRPRAAPTPRIGRTATATVARATWRRLGVTAPAATGLVGAKSGAPSRATQLARPCPPRRAAAVVAATHRSRSRTPLPELPAATPKPRSSPLLPKLRARRRARATAAATAAAAAAAAAAALLSPPRPRRPPRRSRRPRPQRPQPPPQRRSRPRHRRRRPRPRRRRPLCRRRLGARGMAAHAGRSGARVTSRATALAATRTRTQGATGA
mmetsp:Transcript_120147/g.383551  ORF Transcript_120147/g.383551 Transcript_120147/m.383551 type:complete len:259 (+) Transcript_120147:383-1159(+)